MQSEYMALCERLYCIYGLSILFVRLDTLNWTWLHSWKITNLAFNTLRIIHDRTKIIDVKYHLDREQVQLEGIYQLLRYLLRSSLHTYWPSHGSVIFLAAFICCTISYPWQYLIYDNLYFCTDADVCMDRRYVCNNLNVTFVCLFLRVSSAPAQRASSSPDRSGNPRLPARSEGGFLTSVLLKLLRTLKTYSIEPCVLLDESTDAEPSFRGC